MKLIIEPSELADYMKRLHDWYNEGTIFVLSNLPEHSHAAFDHSPAPVRRGQEFNKLWKRYQSEHPRPSWKDLLPD